jgi:hypothetical protein
LSRESGSSTIADTDTVPLVFLVSFSGFSG